MTKNELAAAKENLENQLANSVKISQALNSKVADLEQKLSEVLSPSSKVSQDALKESRAQRREERAEESNSRAHSANWRANEKHSWATKARRGKALKAVYSALDRKEEADQLRGLDVVEAEFGASLVSDLTASAPDRRERSKSILASLKGF